MPIADAIPDLDVLANVAVVFSEKIAATFDYSFGGKP